MLAALSVLNGCASPFDDTDYSDWGAQDPARWRLGKSGVTHERDTLRSRPDDSGLDVPTSAMLPDTGEGPDVYVKLALERNPSIRAAELRVQRHGAVVPEVTSLDDPMLQVAPFGEMAETAAGQVGLMSGVCQKLPYPVKLDTRGKIAQQDVEMAQTELRQTRLRVIADTRRAYWSYYFTTRALETTRENRQLLNQFRQIAEAEYKAGRR